MRDIKMSDVFDLPLEANSLDISNALGDVVGDFSAEDEDKAAVHAINNHDKLTSRVAELEAALTKIKDITGELGGQNPANFCEELAMEQDDATYRVYKLSNSALSKALEQSK